MKIMIVEDSAAVRSFIKSLLAKVADDFVECADGKEALQTYLEHQPDLVLMDIEMKQMGGFAATSKIKAEFPDSRIVIVSYIDTPELRKAAWRAGAERYVNKRELLQLIEIVKG